jgi:hypothetical protein
MGILIFSFVGWESDLFMFWSIENRTIQMIEDPTEKETDRERLFAYTEPWEYVWENPRYLYFGRGLGAEKVNNEIKTENKNENRANHAVFAQAFYSYGLIAAVLYMLLFYSALKKTFDFCRSPSPNTFSKTLLPGLLGLLPWFMLGHAAVSMPRGAMLFFFLMGLVAIQNNLNEEFEANEQRSFVPVNENNVLNG